MKRYKADILSTILPTVLLLTLVLSSCVKESLPDGGEFGEGQATVTLELVPPGAFSEVQTRALTDDKQNAINRAAVFIFKDGVVVQKVNAEKIENNKMTIKGIKTSHSESDKFDIVVIGNPRSDIDMLDYIGMTKEQLRRSDKMGAYYDDKWNGTEIPMWGEVMQVYVHPVTNTFQIKMLRALARIDLGVGSYDEQTGVWGGLSSFKLSEITLKTLTTLIDIIPKPENIDLNGQATDVSSSGKMVGLSTEGKYFGADIINQAYIKSTIFLAETESPLADPVKLIIGGSYEGGATTYYRVDMRLPNNSKPGEYMEINILRNHLYRISITSVLGPGYATVAEANSAPALNNIAVELTPINEGGSGDVIFDKNSSIATDVADAIIYGRTNDPAKPNEVSEYTVVNVKAVFPIEVTNARVTGDGLSAPIILTSANDTPIKVRPANGTTSGKLTITVGRLTKVINYKVNAPVDAHFDFLPFQNVTAITVEKLQSWITLSQNRTYVKDEQQSDYITGDANGKAVVHFDENISTEDVPRTASVLLQRKTTPMSKTRVIFEQVNLKGMVLGLFGGDKNNGGYTKQLAVESVDEYHQRIYDDTPIGAVKSGMKWGFNGVMDNMPVKDAEYGRLSTIMLATTRFSKNGVVPNEADLSIYNNYAARYCYDKNRDTDGSGTLDDKEIVWYLPAQNQLMGAWVAHEGIITPFYTTATYWTATENITNSSWSVHFKDGKTINSSFKTNDYLVRCVREL